jgi:hypothetical protein
MFNVLLAVLFSYESAILPPLNPDSGFSKCYYINGINNTVDTCMEGAQALLKTFHGTANVIPTCDMTLAPFSTEDISTFLKSIFNKTIGFTEDLHSVFESMKPEYESTFIQLLRNQLKEDIAELDRAGDPRKIFLIAFSRGSASIYHVVQPLSQEERGRLIIIACGPTMLLTNDLAFKVLNLLSKRDKLSLSICHIAYNLYPERYRGKKVTRVLLPKQTPSWLKRVFDHEFVSRTYQRGIEKYVGALYAKFGTYSENPPLLLSNN